MKPVVTLVGRPNVGKSTLFNRLTRSKNALVADTPGLTRDRHYGEGRVGDKAYLVVDTGGFEPVSATGIAVAMAEQTKQAIAESDVILFLVDAKTGLLPQDKNIAQFLRQQQAAHYVVINKAEGRQLLLSQSEFYEFGLGTPYVISASHGDGVKELINEVLEPFAESPDSNIVSRPCFAVIGRPNVGKSTLVNALLGAQRVITFNEAGTTRDSIYIDFQHKNQDFTIIDTAGVRKQGKVVAAIEKFSVIKTLKAVEDANVVILVVDATQDIADQDATLGGFAAEKGRACVVVVNKWDAATAVQKETVKKTLSRKLYFLDYAQIHYVSALEGTNWEALFTAVLTAYNSAFKKLPTPKVMRVLQAAVEKQPPAGAKSRFRPKLRYAHQGGSNPPVVVIHGSVTGILDSYTRYLTKNFIQAFDLQGTPLKIKYVATVNPFIAPKEGLSKTKGLRRVKLSNRIAKREKQKQLKKTRAKICSTKR